MEIINDYIQVDHVSKGFLTNGTYLPVLEDISFSMPKGSITCIVGASGCGKSTLLRAIAGIDPRHEGTIRIGGKEIRNPEKSIGMVFQEPRLFPWLTVEKNIHYAMDGVEKEKRDQLTREYIDLVGLTGFEKVYPAQLSGGMAQRAGIARALVNQPPVLLLDEPFGALDTFTKITMQNELKRIQSSSDTTMIMVTHDIDEAIFLSDLIIVLTSRPGRIKALTPVMLPDPRMRNGDDFLQYRKKIYSMFFEEHILEDYSI